MKSDTSTWMRVLLYCFVITTTFVSSASADLPNPADVTLAQADPNMSLRYQPPPEDPKSRRDRLRAPRAGVGISTILAAGGIAMIGTGAAIASIESSCILGPPDCGNEAGPAGKALAGLGGVVTLGALVGLGVSAARLRAHKKARPPSPGLVSLRDRLAP